MSRHQDREQATLALGLVREVVEKDGKVRKDYRSAVRSLPAWIQANGLAQTLAFYVAKAKGNEKKPEWFVAAHLCKGLDMGEDHIQVLELMLKKSSTEYRRTTTRALAFTGWLKRFAEALIPEEK